mgnify:FL=1
MVKWNTKHKSKGEQKLGLLDLGPVLLRTLKLMSNFFYIVIFLFGMMGAGMALGYLASQVDSVRVPSKASLVKQVESLTMMSQMNYSDNSLIATLDTDLLRTPVANDAISDNIKRAIVSTEDEHFQEHKGVVPKAVFRATLALSLIHI